MQHLGGSRPRGRPTEALDEDLQEPVRLFVEALRAQMLEPLKEHRWDYRRIAARLTEEFGKGYSLTTLQRIGAGTKMPPRDVVDSLLTLAHTEGGGLAPGTRESVMTLYYAALAVTDPKLLRFYQLVQERDRYRADSEKLARTAGELRAALAEHRATFAERSRQAAGERQELRRRVAELETSLAALTEEARQARDAAQAVEGELTATVEERDRLRAELAGRQAVDEAESAVATALGAMRDELAGMEALPTDAELNAVVAEAETTRAAGSAPAPPRRRYIPGPPERIWRDIEDLDELLRRPPQSADQALALLRALRAAERHNEIQQMLTRFSDAHTPADVASLVRLLRLNGSAWAQWLVQLWISRLPTMVAVFIAELRRADQHRLVGPLLEECGANWPAEYVGTLIGALYGPASEEYRRTLWRALGQRDLRTADYADLAVAMHAYGRLESLRVWLNARDKRATKSVVAELHKRGNHAFAIVLKGPPV